MPTTQADSNPRHSTARSRDDRAELGDNTELPSDAIAAVKQDSPSGATSDSSVQTKTQRRRELIQFAALCLTLFLTGWNDGTTGPLLPRIQQVYHLNFTEVSLIFVFACIGFLAGALSNVVLNDRYGFGKVVALGAALQVIGYAIASAALPFPAFVLGYAVNSMGLAFLDAQANAYVVSLKNNPEAKIGILHACYGAGALSSPIVATQFAQLPRWSFPYLVSLGIALINTILLIAVFRLKSQDECLAQVGQSPPAQQDKSEKGQSEKGQFRQIFGSKDVHLLALFILVYVGVEVTIGGWIVTYIIDVRGGGPSSGYISSGFFAGLMTGRVALLWINRKVGERRVLFIYAILAIGLEVVIWRVPSLIGDAVCISIIGVLLGPMYPITMGHAGRILPAWLLAGALGWIAGAGQAGSALFPFIAGAIASKAGISSLQPVLVGMMAFLILVWALVPGKASHRTD